MKKRIKEDNIDISHIKLGAGSNKGRKFTQRELSVVNYLTENSSAKGEKLKKSYLKKIF